ncbi:MAG TPA: 16S rRNA (guanine(527)-N(7))-methyltransferase RsmG [Rhodopila sp.]|jgi:16S rRNA (guanine527-N7)-methyltransferase|nr:16S rRNA (guanine(527)-N(7))-methyltransferase RsmG [Rhodopila sp.]
MTGDSDARLRAFADLLLRWNTALNLIAAKDAEVVWARHIADSLQLVPLMPAGITRAVDLGSGGGFPGLVLAIATGVTFDLIESDRRKASFLRTAVLQTGAPATVHNVRIEDAPVPAAPLVTARALAPLPRLLPLAARLLTPEGVCLFLKGAKVEEELAAAEPGWTMAVERFPSQTSPDGMVLRLAGLRDKGG